LSIVSWLLSELKKFLVQDLRWESSAGLFNLKVEFGHLAAVMGVFMEWSWALWVEPQCIGHHIPDYFGMAETLASAHQQGFQLAFELVSREEDPSLWTEARIWHHKEGVTSGGFHFSVSRPPEPRSGPAVIDDEQECDSDNGFDNDDIPF
jgi:hypothetical protein